MLLKWRRTGPPRESRNMDHARKLVQYRDKNFISQVCRVR
jgi:hypothetical protein